MPMIADYEHRINLFHNFLFSVSRCCFSVFTFSLCPSSSFVYSVAFTTETYARTLALFLFYPDSMYTFILICPFVHSFIHFISVSTRHPLPLLHSRWFFSVFLTLKYCRYHWLFGELHFCVCPFCHPSHPTFDRKWQTSNDIRHSIRQIVVEAIPRISGCIYSAYQWRCDAYKYKLSPYRKKSQPTNVLFYTFGTIVMIVLNFPPIRLYTFFFSLCSSSFIVSIISSLLIFGFGWVTLDSCWLLVGWLASLVGIFQLLLRIKMRENRKTKYDKWSKKKSSPVVFIVIQSEPLKGKSGCKTKRRKKGAKKNLIESEIKLCAFLKYFYINISFNVISSYINICIWTDR